MYDVHTSSVHALGAAHYDPQIIGGLLANRSSRGNRNGIDSGAIVVAEGDKQVIDFGDAIPEMAVAIYVDSVLAGYGIAAAPRKHANGIAVASALLAHVGIEP